MTTTTATPTALFTEEEFTIIFDTVDWTIEELGDRRRGGDEDAAELEDYLEEFSHNLGTIEPNKNGLYEVVLDEETYGFLTQRLDDAVEHYEEYCDDPDFDYDPSHETVLENMYQKIHQ